MKKANCFTAALLFIFSNVFGQTIFEDDFNSGTFKSEWTAHPNLTGVNGVVDLNIAADHDNSGFGVRLGKTSDNGGFTTNALDLHLNLAGQPQVELTFWIRDNADETQSFDGLYFSNNGGATFTPIPVLPFKPADWCDLWGQFPPIDVTQLASKHGVPTNGQFVIRFQQHDDGDFSGGTIGHDGFYIDDVRVYAPQLIYAPVSLGNSFCDDFEDGKLDGPWAWRFADSTATLVAFPTKPSNIVGVFSGIGYNNSQYAVAMGKACDDGFTTNALDLHLNLAGQPQVELTFRIRDVADETQNDDGLWFSDDGGLSFTEIYRFRPADWCDEWGQFPPFDVVQLAEKHGLNLTDKFVIRFQQHDDGDFSGGGSTLHDGFYIDDVCVYVPQVTYVPISPGLGFCDDFEDGKLDGPWAWRFADSTATLVAFPTKPSNIVGVFSGIGYNNSQYAVAMGKACDDGFTTNALDLHLNLAGQPQVELTFRIRDIADETQNDDGLWFSDDGGLNFTEVYRFRPADWCDQWGQFPPFDVVQLAEKHGLNLTDKFVIRFQQHDDGDFSGGGSTLHDGFYIDDVCVYVPEVAYASIPFMDDFETGELGSAWAWRFADSTATLAPVPTRPSNFVEVVSGIGHNSQYAVAMGKACDDGFATNALDLHLKLENKTNVKLNFWLKHITEETQDDDGIYFSNNGGLSFVQVYQFNYVSVPANVYVESNPGLDVNALASAHGLSLTDQFIIRFQQHDDGDFSGGGTVLHDGIYLDDINITGTTSAENPTDESGITVFPNPAQHSLTVLRPDASSSLSATYQLFDAQGQLLKTGTLMGEKEQIDLAGIPAGILFLEVREAQQVWRQKVVKQH